MSRLPRVGGARVISVLTRKGFLLLRVRGSHHYLRKPGVTSLVVVPVHGNKVIPQGTLRSIVRQAGLTDEEFVALFE